MNAELDFPPIVDPGATVAAPPAAVAAELVDVADITNGAAVVKFNRTDAALAALAEDLKGKAYDLTTTKGDKAARGDRQRCVTLRSALEEMRKAKKAPALEFGRRIDAEAKRINDAILVLEQPISLQITQDETRRAEEKAEKERVERERVEKLQAGVATIRSYVAHAAGKSADRIALGIARLEAMAFTEADWQEWRRSAEGARDEALETLRDLHAKAVAAEEQAAENERLRELAEQQAAELGRLQAAEAERLRQEQETRAAQERAAAPVAAVGSASIEAQAPQAAPNGAKGEGAYAEHRAPDPSQVESDYTAETFLKIGDLCARLGGLQLTAQFITDKLGVDFAKRERAATYYSGAQCKAIKAALLALISEADL